MKYDHTSRPFAVVTIYADGSGVALREFETRAKADAYVERETSPTRKHEMHVVSLPGLLAWVRAEAVR